MGDRGNILVKDNPEDNGVYLYSHWGGSELPFDLQKALARRVRWDDSAYLTKIILNEITGGDISGETGHGISTEIQDNEHHIITVIVSQKTVVIGSKEWSFTEFVGMPNLKEALEEINF